LSNVLFQITHNEYAQRLREKLNKERILAGGRSANAVFLKTKPEQIRAS
jgi:hypothetical protein